MYLTRSALSRNAALAGDLGVDGPLRQEWNMTATHLTVAVVAALALPATHGNPAESKQRVTAVAPKDIQWSTPAYYTDGRQRAHLLGDSSKGGDWIDRVRIPGDSRVLPHTHPHDEVVTVIDGTWYLGIGEKFDDTKLEPYSAGSFILIPAGFAHFLATKKEPVIVQVSGHGIFRTNYLGE
jgi:uncharacterized RmlC-like cupin family protein